MKHIISTLIVTFALCACGTEMDAELYEAEYENQMTELAQGDDKQANAKSKYEKPGLGSSNGQDGKTGNPNIQALCPEGYTPYSWNGSFCTKMEDGQITDVCCNNAPVCEDSNYNMCH